MPDRKVPYFHKKDVLGQRNMDDMGQSIQEWTK